LRLVEQKCGFLDVEVNKPVFDMNRMGAEVFAEKHVPVRLKVLVHVTLQLFSSLYVIKTFANLLSVHLCCRSPLTLYGFPISQPLRCHLYIQGARGLLHPKIL
jgi:hypothetical protein